MIKAASKVNLVFAVFLFSFLIFYLYSSKIQPANAYFGYLSINLNLEYFLWCFVFLFFSVLLIPVKVKQPSDFFVFFHVFLVVIPFVLLHPSGLSETGWSSILVLFILMIPLFFLLGVRVLKIRVPPFRKYLTTSKSYFIVALFCGFVVLLALVNAPATSGFDIASSYVRRIEAREAYPGGSFYAYANSMVMNGLGPLLAFWAGLRRSLKLFIIPFLIWLSFYYLLGVKAPLVLAIISFLLGFYFKRKKIEYLFLFFVYGCLLLCLLSLLEYVFLGYSYIADYFIRRAFTVPPFLIAIYGDFLSVSVGSEWSFFTGCSADKPISFFIGEDYIGVEGLNANSNAFISSFSSGGVFLYGFVCFVVVAFFSSLDSVYRNESNPNIMFCGFIYAILLVEQSATTVLLSSGIFFIFLMSLFTVDNDVNRGFYLD